MSPLSPDTRSKDSDRESSSSRVTDAPAGKRSESQFAHYLYGALTIMFLLLAWHLAAKYELLNRTLMPSPGEVWNAFVILLTSGQLIEDIKVSLYRILAGFALGLITAIPLGLLVARIRLVKAFLDPLLELIRPIPALAFLPLAILWFGTGEASKLFIMWFGTFFVIIVSVIEGVYNFDVVYLRVARNLDASQAQIFRHVLLPGILPFILEGNRQAIATAFRIVVSAEMIAAQSGLGFLILNSSVFYQSDKVIVGIIALGALGMTFDRLLLHATRHVLLRYKQGAEEVAI